MNIAWGKPDPKRVMALVKIALFLSACAFAYAAVRGGSKGSNVIAGVASATSLLAIVLMILTLEYSPGATPTSPTTSAGELLGLCAEHRAGELSDEEFTKAKGDLLFPTTNDPAGPPGLDSARRGPGAPPSAPAPGSTAVPSE